MSPQQEKPRAQLLQVIGFACPHDMVLILITHFFHAVVHARVGWLTWLTSLIYIQNCQCWYGMLWINTISRNVSIANGGINEHMQKKSAKAILYNPIFQNFLSPEHTLKPPSQQIYEGNPFIWGSLRMLAWEIGNCMCWIYRPPPLRMHGKWRFWLASSVWGSTSNVPVFADESILSIHSIWAKHSCPKDH